MNVTAGEIIVSRQLDWETTQLYSLLVKAEDSGNQPESRFDNVVGLIWPKIYFDAQ